MLLEKSEIQVRPGSEADFARVMDETGLPLLTAVPGVKWAKIGQGVESPSTFIFLVEWDDLAAHQAFNASPVHPQFLQLFAPYAVGGAMAHFRMR